MNNIDYSPLIESICLRLGKQYKKIDRGEQSYYSTQNFFNDDKSPSQQVFINGWISSLNATIVNNETRVHLKTATVMLGLLEEYIKFLLEYHHIEVSEYNTYRETILNNDDRDLKKKFNQIGIYKNDVLGCSYLKYNTNKHTPKVKVKKQTELLEVECNEQDKIKLQECMNKRCLVEQSNLKPTKLLLKGEGYSFENLALALVYNNDCIRYRLLDSKMRYLSKGNINGFFKAKTNCCAKYAIIGEGCIDMLSLSYVDDIETDIYSNGSTSTCICDVDLSKYEKVLFLLDNDKFLVNIEGIKDKMKYYQHIIYAPKFKDIDTDFNEYLCNHGIEELKKYYYKNIKEMLL